MTSSNIAESALKLLATEGLPREQRCRSIEEDQDELPNLNGFEAAETIKKYLPSATIYFVTVISFSPRL